jgi:chemotaxis protein CheC
MQIDPAGFLTELEIDAFQELMNIVFGRAAADLDEVINIRVILSVPMLKMIRASELPAFISENIDEGAMRSTLVEQTFLGRFSGVALIVFPHDDENKFVTLFRENEAMYADYGSPMELEKEILLEVGNILIGACVSKLSVMLNESVMYEPPAIAFKDTIKTGFYNKLLKADNWAIVLKTSFRFEADDLSCYFFLVTSEQSLIWLKKAINDYLNQF